MVKFFAGKDGIRNPFLVVALLVTIFSAHRCVDNSNYLSSYAYIYILIISIEIRYVLLSRIEQFSLVDIYTFSLRMDTYHIYLSVLGYNVYI